MRSCLGQVAAVGADGVFVVTPGVRGVVRGPFGSLHPVAVGDRVLVVTTDDGQTVVAGSLVEPEDE